MILYIWIVSACWMVFILYWIIAGFSAKKTVGSTRRWFLTRATILAVILVVFGNQFSSGWANYHIASSGLESFGVIICIIGIGLAVWARVYLGKNWGMPRTVRENPDLITDGPYKYVRHPIYTGVLLAMLGTGFVISLVWLLLLVIYGSYFIYSAFQEEKLMQKTFPETYSAYKARTKMLIPFIF